MIPIIYANRALGILGKFILNKPEIEHWYLPANICFSVPFLFLNLNKKIQFYDFGFDTSIILNTLQENKTTNCGVLLFDYYGKSWTEEQVKEIKPFVNCVIQDACLSIPTIETNKQIAADLLIYSTGKGKVVDIGSGAIGYTSHLEDALYIKNNLENTGSENKTYLELDRYWKSIISNKDVFDLNRVKNVSWVDYGNNTITENYPKDVILERDKIIKHKTTINDLYSNLINKELHWNIYANNWRFNLWINNATELITEIFNHNLFASRHYPDVSHFLKIENTLPLPKAIKVEKHVVNLFNDFHITEKQAEECALLVNKLFHQNKIQPVS